MTAAIALNGDEDRRSRLVARQVSELMLRRGARWQAATGTDPLDWLLLQVVLSANLSHVPGGRDRPLPVQPRPVSLMAVAGSMRLPYETVRRRVTQLRAAGLIEADAGGARVIGAAMPPVRAGRLLHADAAALGEALRSLAMAGHGPAGAALAAGIARVRLRAQGRALLDFSVRIMEDFVAFYGGMIPGVVFVAIVAANIHHLLDDPAHHAGLLPDDADRRPVPLRALARSLRMPWETLRRQVNRLVAAERAVMTGDGVLVPSHVLATETHLAYNRLIQTQFERMLTGLTRR
jgi:hypothetical protein